MSTPTVEALLERIETLEQSSQQRRQRRRRPRIALLAIAVVAVLAVPIGVFANHSFTDVPNSNTFHTQIARVKGAGITAGCTATTYCPEAAVSRGQMAAFLARTGGRAAEVTWSQSTTLTNTDTVIAQISIKAGDVTGGTALVLLTANPSAYTTTLTGCPCGAVFYLEEFAGAPAYAQMVAFNLGSAFSVSTTSVVGLVAVPTGVTQTFNLHGQRTEGTAAMSTYGAITALYVPFEGPGTNPIVSAADPAGEGQLLPPGD